MLRGLALRRPRKHGRMEGVLADEVSSYRGLSLLGCVVNTQRNRPSMTKNPEDDFEGQGRAKLGAAYGPTKSTINIGTNDPFLDEATQGTTPKRKGSPFHGYVTRCFMAPVLFSIISVSRITKSLCQQSENARGEREHCLQS